MDKKLAHANIHNLDIIFATSFIFAPDHFAAKCAKISTFTVIANGAEVHSFIFRIENKMSADKFVTNSKKFCRIQNFLRGSNLYLCSKAHKLCCKITRDREGKKVFAAVYGQISNTTPSH